MDLASSSNDSVINCIERTFKNLFRADTCAFVNMNTARTEVDSLAARLNSSLSWRRKSRLNKYIARSYFLTMNANTGLYDIENDVRDRESEYA